MYSSQYRLVLTNPEFLGQIIGNDIEKNSSRNIHEGVNTRAVNSGAYRDVSRNTANVASGGNSTSSVSGTGGGAHSGGGGCECGAGQGAQLVGADDRDDLFVCEV